MYTGTLFGNIKRTTFTYGNDPKFSDRQVCANSVDPDQTAPEEQSDQGLHCLLFHVDILHTLLNRKATLFKF